MGIEHLDIFGSHSFPLQVDERSRQDFEVGFEMHDSRFGEAGRHLHLQLPLILGPEELAPHAATDRRKEVEHGVGTVLARPFEQDHPGDRERLAEELAPVVPVPSLPPAQSFGDGE